MSAPILVTGMPRTGTTWLARMLDASGGLVYVNEPLNPLHPPGRSPGVLAAEVEHRFQYICEDNEDKFLPAYRDLLELRFRIGAELRANHKPGDFARAMRYQLNFVKGRLWRRRVLIADPFAVFSTEWFARRLGCQVVVIVRHPAATISSRKRLDWKIDFRELLDQPLLMRDHLAGTEADLRAAGADDVMTQGALLWLAIYRSVAKLRDVPGVTLVRHEDLSLEPVDGFRRLYRILGLPFSERARRHISAATSSDNASELPLGKPHRTQLNSRLNLDNWKRRLGESEISRIRDLTGATARELYGYDEWQAHEVGTAATQQAVSSALTATCASEGRDT